MSYVSTHTLFFKESITAFVFSSRHITCAIFSYRKGRPNCSHIFLIMIHVLVWYSTHVSSCRLFSRELRINWMPNHTVRWPVRPSVMKNPNSEQQKNAKQSSIAMSRASTEHGHKDSWLPRHDLTEVQAGEVSNTWRFCSAVWNVCRSLCSVVNSSHAELGQRRGRFLTRRRSSCNFCGPRGPWHEPNAETCLKDTPNANRGCGFFFNRLAARPATALASNSSSSLDPVVVSFGDLEATIHVALASTLFVSCCTIVRTSKYPDQFFPNWPKGSMYHMKLSCSAGKECEKMPVCRKTSLWASCSRT